MRLYTISGLGADQRVFNYLNLDHELIPLPWIKHRPGDTLRSYAMRLAEGIDQREPFGIVGLSFGGLVAVEISKELSPNAAILISSVETRDELPIWIRLIGKTKVLYPIPVALLKPPIWLMKYVFSTNRSDLIEAISHDTNWEFAKWCAMRLCEWNNRTRIEKALKISGSRDRLLPPGKDPSIKIVRNTGHFMIVDRAEAVSGLINEHLNKML